MWLVSFSFSFRNVLLFSFVTFHDEPERTFDAFPACSCPCCFTYKSGRNFVIVHMSLDEIDIEGSARSPSQMCFSGDDYDRMDLELVSCDARIVVGKVDSNV